MVTRLRDQVDPARARVCLEQCWPKQTRPAVQK
jgi:hypothetical protein